MKLLRSVISKIGFAENKQVDFNNNIHFIYGKNNSGKTLIAKSFIDTLYPQEPSLIVADEWDTMFATFTIQSNLTNIAIQRKGNKEVKIFTATDGDTRAKELSLQLPVVANSFSGDSYLKRLHDLFNKASFSLLLAATAGSSQTTPKLKLLGLPFQCETTEDRASRQGPTGKPTVDARTV